MSRKTGNQKSILHNMISSLLYHCCVICFGLILPRLFLTAFGSELNGLDSTIKQVFSCLALLEAGVGLASQQAYYKPVAVDDRAGINGIFSANSYYYRRTGWIYTVATLAFALVYPLLVQTALPYGLVFAVILIYGLPGILSYFVQGRYRSFMEVAGKAYVVNYITTATLAVGNLLRVAALLYGKNLLVVQLTYCVPSLFQIVLTVGYIRRHYPWLDGKCAPNLTALSQKNSVLLHQLSQMVFNNTDVIVISSFCGFLQASVYAVYMVFFSNVEKLFYAVTNSVSFRLGQLFHTDRRRFLVCYRLYQTVYAALAFALFTTMALFILPIISLYTKGVTDADYYRPLLVALFTAVNLLSCVKGPPNLVVTYGGHFEATRHQAIWEMVINLGITLCTVTRLGIAGCLIGTAAALLYRYVALTLYASRVILQTSPWRSFARLLINGVLCAAILALIGLESCNGGGYLAVLWRGALHGLWILPVFLLANGLLDPQSLRFGWQALRVRASKRKE